MKIITSAEFRQFEKIGFEREMKDDKYWKGKGKKKRKRKKINLLNMSPKYIHWWMRFRGSKGTVQFLFPSKYKDIN